MTIQEIKEACKELELSLLESLEVENKLIEAQGDKERSRKRLQLAKIFLIK